MLALNGTGNLALHELIEDQARRTPERPAVVFEEQTLTYGELDRRAGLVARRLHEEGAGRDVLVGLLVERSAEMVVGILAILKAGSAYLPIDPGYPRERITYMLGDAGVRLIVGDRRLLPSGLASDVKVLGLDGLDAQAFGEAPGPAASVQPNDLAYVIYTSGSTGRPKGVGIEHRNIVNYVVGVTERLDLRPGMSFATVSTIAADLGNTVIFPALATGGCLHVISQERAESQALLSEYFTRHGIDVLKIVPSHLAALLQSGRDPHRVMPRSRLILGGEASRLEWIERLRALSPDCEIHNHYGPTETTVGVLTHHVRPQEPGTSSGTLPLGKPLPNTQVYLLDGEGREVPAGEQGELWIGGRGVGRGYLDRPELTAERFVADPSDASARLYRTGDLGRRLPDGSIEFCGRVDHQVKLRGYRVELGEIEGALRDHGGVSDAVVLAPEDGAGERHLVACVVPKRADQPLWDLPSLHVLPDGAAVAHLNKSETEYIYNEVFGLQAYLRHGITIEDGDCVVDAGANIGMFTLFASRLARNLRITAFEPNPAAFACLKANAEAWGNGVSCLPMGLSRADGAGQLTFFEGLSLLSGFYADAAAEREVVRNYVLNQEAGAAADARMAAEVGELIDGRLRATTVSAPLRNLSSVIAEQGLERIDLLKVNVEKSELDVLLGIRPEDWPRIRQLVIEVDQRESLEPILMLLEGHGFDVLSEQDPLLRKTELCYVYAIRPSAGRALRRDAAAQAHVRSLPDVRPDVLTPQTLKRHLKERLPSYMVPSALVLMERLPLTANGKVDRQALMAVSHETPAPLAPEPDRPPTETEAALAAIWAELLGVERVSMNDDFFDLGGHSLLAMRAVSRIRDVFEVDLPLRNLFERPTVAGLADVIEGLSWVAQADTPAGVGAGREEVEL